MNRNKKIWAESIYPALWGILIYNVLRAVTDLTRHGIFWEGEISLHLTALVFSIIVCYIGNYIWRNKLEKSSFDTNIAVEYLQVFIRLIIFLNLLLLTGQAAGILFMGAGWIDYMLINATYAPLMLIFYTLIRNSIIGRKIQDKMLAMERLNAEKKEAELNFLKSQYHPHFLFNALNTIYFQINDTNIEARKSIEHLSGLLRYQLYDVNQVVALNKEIEYLLSYIGFQQLRKTDRLVVNIDIDSALQKQKVHPLLFQPLIENAFKYVTGIYQIDLKMKLEGSELHFVLKNSISDIIVSSEVSDSGIGLSNLKRRLELLYPEKHILIIEKIDSYFSATLKLQIIN